MVGKLKIARTGDWLSARVDRELLMMSAANGKYLGLTEVGARVWELLETESYLDRICEALQGEFDVTPDVCRAEVEVFLNAMASEGMVTIERA
jgi:hypothetical protein